MEHWKDPDDYTPADVSELIMAYRDMRRRLDERTARAQSVADRVNETIRALMLARDAAIIAAAD